MKHHQGQNSSRLRLGWLCQPRHGPQPVPGWLCQHRRSSGQPGFAELWEEAAAMPVLGFLPCWRTPPVCLTGTYLEHCPPLHRDPRPTPSPIPSSVLSRMLRTSASSKESSSGCWATYGWTHWICGQSAREQGESERWSGTEPTAGQHGSGECTTASAANGLSDLVGNPAEATGCPSHGDRGSISVGITTAVLPMLGWEEECWCSPAQVGGEQGLDQARRQVGVDGGNTRGAQGEGSALAETPGLGPDSDRAEEGALG